MMNKILRFCLACLIGGIIGIFLTSLFFSCYWVLAQQQIVRQTDPDDIDTRQRIDRELEEKIRLLDRQIQADTVLLVGGATQVVYLDRKYADADYQVFLEYRIFRGSGTIFQAAPTTDSSFTITKNVNDISTIQYMAIHKGD